MGTVVRTQEELMCTLFFYSKHAVNNSCPKVIGLLRVKLLERSLILEMQLFSLGNPIGHAAANIRHAGHLFANVVETNSQPRYQTDIGRRW